MVCMGEGVMQCECLIELIEKMVTLIFLLIFLILTIFYHLCRVICLINEIGIFTSQCCSNTGKLCLFTMCKCFFLHGN